jgi:Ca2+-binding RTX toxin-like protein
MFGGDGDESGPEIVVGTQGWRATPGLFGQAGDDYLDGGGGNDWLEGGEGNDVLIGSIGNDTMIGGNGNDTYFVADPTDVISEWGTTGVDAVRASVNFVLRSGFEHLYLTGSALKGTGNTLANKVVGNTAANTLAGGSGNDTLDGGAGADQLLGGTGNDALLGRDGNDVLTGGRGRDLLYGGLGRDRLVFDDADTGAAASTADIVMDFAGRLGDRIDLKLVDANRAASGDQAFSFIGTHAFTKAGQLRYEKIGSSTYVYLNTDADLSAEAVIRLKGAMELSKGWFLL